MPMEETLRHVRWSGRAGYILAPALHDPSFPLENRVSFYIPRTLDLKPEHGEVAISYRPAQARDGTGTNGPPSLRRSRVTRTPSLNALRGRSTRARNTRHQAEGVLIRGTAHSGLG
ncbi:MAG: DUF3830 family protein [Chloroflexi bacterium]|nr:DUF3830 family protein [Chloroflexota bacterium]